MIGPQVSEELRHLLLALLPAGRRFPVRASELARELGVSTRTVGGLVEDLVDEGYLIGSSCAPEAPGYFLISDVEDLEAGTAHLVSRARAMFVRVAKVRALARERFEEPEVLRLFNLDHSPAGTAESVDGRDTPSEPLPQGSTTEITS